jgi:hypothetical protein
LKYLVGGWEVVVVGSVRDVVDLRVGGVDRSPEEL